MQPVLEKLGLTDVSDGVFDGEWRGGGAKIDKISSIDGRRVASVRTASDDDYNKAIARAHEAFLKWRTTPGPVRGETVRRLGNALRDLKQELGQLVTLETGKIIAEGEGEGEGVGVGVGTPPDELTKDVWIRKTVFALRNASPFVPHLTSVFPISLTGPRSTEPSGTNVFRS